MSLPIYDTMVPQGNYPAVNAADVLMPDGTWLDTWKPQGGATTEAALFPEQEMTAFNQIPTGAYAVAEGGILFSLVAGEAYRVVYRGESYTVTAAEPKSGLISLGNAALMGDYEDTGEAFLIYTDAETDFTMFLASTDGPHTFGVYQTVEPPKLPGVTEADEGKALVVRDGALTFEKITGGAGSWNDLTDKPFYEQTSTMPVLGALTFTSTLDETWGYSHSADVSFALSIGEAYTVRWDGVEYICEAADGNAAMDDTIYLGNGTSLGLSGNGEPFAVAITGTGLMLIACLEDTVPTAHTLAISQDTTIVKTLDVKFLPMNAIDARIDAYIEEALGGDY